jgi:hypothetical protein
MPKVHPTFFIHVGAGGRGLPGPLWPGRDKTVTWVESWAKGTEHRGLCSAHRRVKVAMRQCVIVFSCRPGQERQFP